MSLFCGGTRTWLVALGVTFGCAPHAASPAAGGTSAKLPGPAGTSLYDIRNALPVRVTRSYVGVVGTPEISLPALGEAEVFAPESGAPRGRSLYIPALAAAVRGLPAKYSAAVLYVDVGTPFRTLVEVLATLGWTDIGDFVLATDAEAGDPSGTARGWATRAPAKGVQGALSVFIVSSGFSLNLEKRHVGANCVLGTLGLTVSNVSGPRDYAGLSRCVSSLLASVESGTRSSAVEPRLANIVANPQTPYLDTTRTIAALYAAGINAFHFGGAQGAERVAPGIDSTFVDGGGAPH